MKHPSLIYLVLCLWCWAPLAQLRAIPLAQFLSGSPPSASFTAKTAVFDGTNDYINLTGTTGLADGSAFTCSFWVDLSNSDGEAQYFYRVASERVAIFKNASNQIQLTGISTGGTTLLSATSSTTLTAAGGWYHVYVFVDLTNSANRGIIINGTEDASVTWSVYTSGTMDILYTDHRIGARASGLDKFEGTMCEFWFNDSYLEDLSKFASANRPISLGADGSLPTGSQPAYYFSLAGDGDTWATNAGSAGNGTVVGALTAGTPP